MEQVEPQAEGCLLEADGGGRYRLAGRMGMAAAAALLERGNREFAGQPQVEVDLSGVTDADSAGLALLLEWTRLARAARRSISFRCIPARLDGLARISGVRELLPLAGD